MTELVQQVDYGMWIECMHLKDVVIDSTRRPLTIVTNLGFCVHFIHRMDTKPVAFDDGL